MSMNSKQQAATTLEHDSLTETIWSYHKWTL